MKKLSKQISPKVPSRSETIEELHQHSIKKNFIEVNYLKIASRSETIEERQQYSIRMKNYRSKKT